MLGFSSCKKNKSNYNEDYKSFGFANKEWKSKKFIHSFDEISYSATEVPLQYYILKNGNKNVKDIDSIYAINSKERIIEVEFKHQDGKDLLLEDFTHKTYENSVKYMSFLIEKDFKVVTESNDTIVCAGVHFERNFKVAPFKRLLLYFNNINPDKHIKLIYDDALFGNGVMEFNFQETPLKL